MEIALVTNMNGAGLQKDAELLGEFLNGLEHKIVVYQYDGEYPVLEEHDLAIYLEVLPQHLLGLSKRRWWFVNPEFAKSDKIDLAKRFIEKAFTKTHEAQRIIEEILPGKTHYVGFLCRDQYDPGIRRQPIFLCVAGQSIIRGAEAVYDAWQWKKNGEGLKADLVIISTTLNRPSRQGIMVLKRLDEKDFKHMQNMCKFHLCLSGTEGYGHALHEALSVGAVIVAPAAPPMNEVKHASYVPAQKVDYCGCADIYEVSALDIYETVKLVEKNAEVIEPWEWNVAKPRQEFLDGVQAFKDAFAGHLAELEKPNVAEVEPEKPYAPVLRTPGGSGKKCVAFLGNFEASESTENMIKWALVERLGMEVMELQENKTNLATLEAVAPYSDYFLWVRTPGWLNVSDEKMIDFLFSMWQKRVPTLSVHLDKFWGIPEREALIGKHPFWLTQFVFTADGSRQEDFLKRGVNHIWMRPAVSEVYCHPGTPREEFKCDVMFCGAREYHSEYPFRATMVDFLKATYGNRFRHLEGVRGHLLNDAYASAKVIVGDCFQAGTPNYWSDRVPETCGRYGHLLHPSVAGLTIPVLQYEAQNLESLKEYVDVALEMTQDVRTFATICNARHVMEHDTWSVRMREIFNLVDHYAERTIAT